MGWDNGMGLRDKKVKVKKGSLDCICVLIKLYQGRSNKSRIICSPGFHILRRSPHLDFIINTTTTVIISSIF